MSSFKKIDYSLRPAKHAERKMLAEIFRKVRPFAPTEEYTYIGFGSVWFSDFILFHRALGVKKMISLEKSSGSKGRIDANRPFEIKVVYQRANVALPGLDWSTRHFIWLDYDCPINTEILSDIRIVAGRCRSGTLFAVSTQVNAAGAYEDAKQDSSVSAVTRFRTEFGRKRVPADLHTEQLSSWRFAKLSRSMLRSEAEDALVSRSRDSEPLQFKVVCEIEYSDDAKMTTLVGMFVSPDDEAKFDECGFGSLDFVNGGSRVVRIDMPKLTTREIRAIEQQLPMEDHTRLELGHIPPSDARKFARIYRYFPNFSVVEG